MVEILWTLLLIIEVDGEGSGYVATERFGPFASEQQCRAVAMSFAEPAYRDRGFDADLQAHCVPETAAN